MSRGIMRLASAHIGVITAAIAVLFSCAGDKKNPADGGTGLPPAAPSELVAAAVRHPHANREVRPLLKIQSRIHLQLIANDPEKSVVLRARSRSELERVGVIGQVDIVGRQNSNDSANGHFLIDGRGDQKQITRRFAEAISRQEPLPGSTRHRHEGGVTDICNPLRVEQVDIATAVRG